MSPVQCNRCLRFGQILKNFAAANQDEAIVVELTRYSFSVCPSAHTIDPVCIFCNLTTGHSCREWLFQREIKKIMATENISYREALDLKKTTIIPPL